MRPLHWSNPADLHDGDNAIGSAQSSPYHRREQSRLEEERWRIRQMAVIVMLFVHNPAAVNGRLQQPVCRPHGRSVHVTVAFT